MHELVKLLTDDDREVYHNPQWHIIDDFGSDPATLCTGEYFGEGQSECTYELKVVKRGGVTCQACLAKAKWLKSFRL